MGDRVVTGQARAGGGATALIVVDMQNDFVRVGAPFEVPQSRPIVPAIAGLVARWRAAAAPVVFTRYVADERLFHLAGKLPWIAKLGDPLRACVTGERRLYGDVEGPREGVAVIDELQPLAGELVVEKAFYSAFHETELQDFLARRAVGSILVTGVITEMCVADTARHAVHHGYRTAILSDAVASRAPLDHARTLAEFDANYGWCFAAAEIDRHGFAAA